MPSLAADSDDALVLPMRQMSVGAIEVPRGGGSGGLATVLEQIGQCSVLDVSRCTRVASTENEVPHAVQSVRTDSRDVRRSSAEYRLTQSRVDLPAATATSNASRMP